MYSHWQSNMSASQRRFSISDLNHRKRHLIRADGNPKMAMFVTVSGAVINIVLDALFVFGFQWGMYGAAWATVIGQIISAAIAIRYLMHYHTVTLEKQHFILPGKFSHRSVPSACPQALTRLP